MKLPKMEGLLLQEKLEKLVKGFLKKLLLETKNLEFGMKLITKSFGIKHNTLEML